MFTGKEFAVAIANRKFFAYRAVGCAEQLEASRGVVGFEVDDGLRLVVLHTVGEAAAKAAAAEGYVYRFEQVCLARTVWSNDDSSARCKRCLIEAVGAKMI